MNTTKSTALLVSIALLSGLAGGALSNAFFSRPSDRHSNNGSEIVQPITMKLIEEESQIIDTIKKVSPSVVSIVLTQELKTIRNQGKAPFDLFFQGDPFFDQFFGRNFVEPQPQPEAEQQPEEDDQSYTQKVGGGSGFIISDSGLILTNRHVVSRDDVDYTVITSVGAEFKGEVVSRDIFNDVAVIKLVAEDGADLPQLTPITIGTSSNLDIGQSVIAIGNALAEFQNSATRGIISAKGRKIIASDGMGRGENLSGLLQTDAAINPGNSGGPLINLAGEVVGINTAIAQGATGIGFAIPIDDIKPIIKSVQENGRIIRPILGVMFTMLTPELAKELELDIEEGALLRGDGVNFAVLPGKPAEKAGLQEKDIIIEVDDEAVTNDNPLQSIIAKHSPGDTIKVKYLRSGKEREETIVLDEADVEARK